MNLLTNGLALNRICLSGIFCLSFGAVVTAIWAAMVATVFLLQVFLTSSGRYITRFAIAILSRAMRRDAGLAWTWHCNISHTCYLAGAPLDNANEHAAKFMQRTFGIDTTPMMLRYKKMFYEALRHTEHIVKGEVTDA